MPKVIKKINVEQTGKRSTLGEGRNYQMGFTFLSKGPKGQFTTLYPFSACKDYLNDWCYTEATGQSINAYGLITDAKQKLIKKGKAYLGVTILERQGGGDYGKKVDFGPIETDRENLRANIKNVLALVNHFDDHFKVEPTALISTSDPNVWIFEVDAFWVRYSYRISMYTLLIRMAQFWNGEGTPINFLNNYKVSLDESMWKNAKAEIEKLLEHGMPEYDYTKIVTPDDYSLSSIAHNSGIIGTFNSYKSFWDNIKI